MVGAVEYVAYRALVKIQLIAPKDDLSQVKRHELYKENTA